MDFFKTCTTNVHVVENFAQTRYTSFGWIAADEQRRWSNIQHTLIGLRKQRVLCAATSQDVWVFGGDPGASIMESLENDHAQIVDTGSVWGDFPNPSARGKVARDILLEAIEGAMAFALAGKVGMNQIRPWTWVHSGIHFTDGPLSESSLIRLHAKFSKTGALYLISEILPNALYPLCNFEPGMTCLLAPYGRTAKILPAATSKTASDDCWKDAISLAIQAQGAALRDASFWMPVHLTGTADSDSFLWPTELCFSLQSPADQRAIQEYGSDWRSWFATTDEKTTFRNPVALSEEWFQDVSERNRLALESISQDAITTSDADLNRLQANAANPAGHGASSTISPPFNQRLADQQAAMAGIYPTPPDGLAQATQTTQFIPALTPSLMQGDTTLAGNDLLPTSDDSQNKPSTLDEMTGLDGYPIEQEDLFGDVEQMEFEENDIGDADFNFFDDQPSDAPSLSAPGDAAMLDASDQHGNSDIVDADHAEVASYSMKIEPSELVAYILNSPSHTKDNEHKHPIMLDDERQSQKEYDIKERPPGLPFDNTRRFQLEKPLSPFGIREKLLPPPVPASIAQSDAKEAGARPESDFSPIVFCSNSDWNNKYIIDHSKISSFRHSSTTSVPNISLPRKRKKSHAIFPEAAPEQNGDAESESEDDSFESLSSESEPDLPPRMPWDNRKRKRHGGHDSLYTSAGSLTNIRSDDAANEDCERHLSSDDITQLLRQCLTPDVVDTSNVSRLDSKAKMAPDSLNNIIGVDNLPPLEDATDIHREDLIYIAQIVSMQAVTALGSAQLQSELFAYDLPRKTMTPFAMLRRLLSQLLDATFEGLELCDLAKIAMNRESVPPLRTASNTNKGLQIQPPRPLPQRADSMMGAPDYFPLHAPHVRIQRGIDNWEMLPSCLPFWETLGLGPANGPKDVRAFCVFPDNDDLQQIVEHFLADIGIAYEGCKLGSHVHLRNVSDKDDCFEDGMAPVELEDNSLQGALRAYASTCIDLGKTLAAISHQETGRTTVVYMVNPFRGHNAVQYLCACFYQMFNAYKDNIPKAHRNQCGSDVVLQLIPINLIAASDMLIVLDAKDMAMLAREVYDRCPPRAIARGAENTSILPILAAPSVELASAAPRKIGFQLSAEPPSDLLHEGSVLHLAYAVSKDGLWMTAVWVDNTSQHQAISTFCLRGRTFRDVAEDVWERTREIIAARQVTWRIFVVTHQTMDRSTSECWRALSSRPRLQSLCVTLLSVQLDPIVQLSTPAPPDSNGPFDAGFLTPASTPQAANFTSSPDVMGHGGLPNAPPTPAPSEATTAIAENDPEAHLIDVKDETWGAVLSCKPINNDNALAEGALYRRGEESRDASLGSLGVIVHWTIQVKPNGTLDEGSPKQGELTLREALRLYRNLSLLTRARALEEDESTGPVPVHVVSAIRSVEGLQGMLKKI